METQSRYDNIEIVTVCEPKLTIESNPATIQFEYKFICMETHSIDKLMYALFGIGPIRRMHIATRFELGKHH